MITLLEYTFDHFLKGSSHIEQTRNQKFPRLREITLLASFERILATLNTLEIKKILASASLHS